MLIVILLMNHIRFSNSKNFDVIGINIFLYFKFLLYDKVVKYMLNYFIYLKCKRKGIGSIHIQKTYSMCVHFFKSFEF